MARQASINVTARWDRPAVPTGKGETWLVVSLRTARAKATTTRSAVDVAFVIDRSGSMSGYPLQLAKQGVIDALDLLTDGDGVAVVAYDHIPTTIAPLIPATKSHRTGVARDLRELEVAGSTNLFGGWALGCTHLAHPEFNVRGRIRRTIVLTDGLANVGIVDPRQIAQAVAQQREAGVITSMLGLGTGIDEALLSAMAEAGGGSFSFVEHPDGLPAFFARELGEALSIMATGAKLTLTLPKGIRATLLNPFPIEREGKRITVSLGDLPSGMALDLVFSVTTRVKSEGVLPPLTLTADWIPAGDAREPMAPVAVSPSVDALMAVDPKAFATMPRDEEAAEAVARVVYEDARRSALRKYRSGDVGGAHAVVHAARHMAASAPISGAQLSDGLDEMIQLDPQSIEFQLRSRQIEHDTHRRNRGREA